MKTPASLRRRILAPIAALGAAAAVGVGFAAYYRTAPLLLSSVQRTEEVLADAIDDLAEASGKSPQLIRSVNSLAGHPGVKLVLVAAGSPLEVIASSRNAWIGLPVDRLPDAALAARIARVAAGVSRERWREPATSHFGYATPLLINRESPFNRLGRGAVVVVIDGEPAERALQATALALSVQGGIIALILVGAGLALLNRGLLGPISLIKETIQRREDGDSLARAPAVSTAELGALALSLNRLFDVLNEKEDLLRGQADQLRLARDHAVASAEAKGSFLANMSHELRTPMNGVIGMANLLLDTGLDSEQKDLVLSLRGSANALLTLLNEILDFSKIEAGKISLEDIGFDLPELIESTVQVMAPKASEKGISLVSVIAPQVPQFVRGDPGRLRQILLNLIGNAVKFTMNGGVTITVASEACEGARAGLRFEVSDTGIGMSEEARSRLFQSFMQADSSTTRRFGGTGLGLVISKRLVELMGGEIGIESQPGNGSTFWIRAGFGAIQSPPPLTFSGGGRVLLVDDNPVSCEAHASIIAGWNLDVECLADGEDPIGRLLEARPGPGRFELAVVALPAPGIRQLVDRLNATPALGDIRLIALMPFGVPASRAGTLANGTLDCLPRPVRHVQFMEALFGVKVYRPGAPCNHGALPAGKPEPMQVLLVEDNPVNRKIALKLLEKLGHVVDVAEHGQEAVIKTTAKTYDTILMDCQMPVMDGFDATRRIREMEGSARHTWIVALTANAMKGDRENCIAAGMDDYLSKPFQPDELRRVLATARAGGAAPVRARDLPSSFALPSRN